MYFSLLVYKKGSKVHELVKFHIYIYMSQCTEEGFKSRMALHSLCGKVMNAG